MLILLIFSLIIIAPQQTHTHAYARTQKSSLQQFYAYEEKKAAETGVFLF